MKTSDERYFHSGWPKTVKLRNASTLSKWKIRSCSSSAISRSVSFFSNPPSELVSVAVGGFVFAGCAEAQTAQPSNNASTTQYARKNHSNFAFMPRENIQRPSARKL